MPALIDLRRRIKSVQNTQQITQAMKTVSTAKFKKAQRSVIQARPYWHTFPSFLHRAILGREGNSLPLLEEREEQNAIVVVITSDKGLCGAFNSNLLARAEEFIEQKSQTCDLRLVLIGKKAAMFFKHLTYPIERTYGENTQIPTQEDLKQLARFLIREYSLLRTDAVYAFYNEFKSILAPHITLYKLLPVEVRKKETKDGEKKEEWHAGLTPDWDPEAERFLAILLPLYFENEIAHFFFESIAAEHAARMMAMENATINAQDLIEDLTLGLNKVRQASITKELLEIMTAVEALAKK
jgi:F-type H+-transporting ATPase subunit gamma